MLMLSSHYRGNSLPKPQSVVTRQVPIILERKNTSERIIKQDSTHHNSTHRTPQTRKYKWNKSTYAPGIYIVQIATDTERTAYKEEKRNATNRVKSNRKEKRRKRKKEKKHGGTWENTQGNTEENTQTCKQAGRGAAVPNRENKIIIHLGIPCYESHARTKKAKKAKERDKKH